jgi:hypothetical protein
MVCGIGLNLTPMPFGSLGQSGLAIWVGLQDGSVVEVELFVLKWHVEAR